MKRMTMFFFGLIATLAFPIYNASAAHIELKTVNARQAYVDTFYNKTVAQLIYDEASQHNINPRLILVLLQRESSSVTQSTPSSTTREAWPLFYNYDERMAACLNGDTGSCNDSKYNKSDYSYRAENYGGVGQQIAYGTAQLRNLHDNASYCGSSTSVSVDGSTITTDNKGTCALYKYTPHYSAYNTDSNFYNYWLQWFGETPTKGGAVSLTTTINEDNFTNPNNMTVADINNFLVAKGSWLGNYTIAEYLSVPYPVAVEDTPAVPSRKTGDANGDNSVDSTDLSILADQWGKGVTANTGADFNGDGGVDSTDLSILADAWGK